MADDARQSQGVASEGYAGCYGPHEPKSLQHIVSHRHVSDVPQRAHFSVEDIVPSEYNDRSHVLVRMFCALTLFSLAQPVVRRPLATKKNAFAVSQPVRLCDVIGSQEVRAEVAEGRGRADPFVVCEQAPMNDPPHSREISLVAYRSAP